VAQIEVTQQPAGAQRGGGMASSKDTAMVQQLSGTAAQQHMRGKQDGGANRGDVTSSLCDSHG
jgi:hypothetical protein